MVLLQADWLEPEPAMMVAPEQKHFELVGMVVVRNVAVVGI
jgi:hypothetical protein